MKLSATLLIRLQNIQLVVNHVRSYSVHMYVHIQVYACVTYAYVLYKYIANYNKSVAKPSHGFQNDCFMITNKTVETS